MSYVLEKGTFVSSGADEIITLRSGMDVIETFNYTVLDAAGANNLATAYWQVGMGDGGIGWIKENTIGAMVPDALTAATGFVVENTYLDRIIPGALNATITTIDAATPPLVSLTDTTGLQNGDIVRILDVGGANQLGGYEFAIDNLVLNTQFELSFAPTIITTGVIIGGELRKAGRIGDKFYPAKRFISNITQAAQAVVTLTVPPYIYQVNDYVRFMVPADFDMVEIDGLIGQITVVNEAASTVTVDIDTTGFDAFDFPATAGIPFSPAMMLPVGTARRDVLSSTYDGDSLGMIIRAGAAAPAGQANDVIFWRSLKVL